ncbi:MAG TPA: class I SAM-dependent methyltransferase [Planctomycetaceae bacterium]|nr:class I SAM-dependent methyltransferase [Planctomycetaceae bacterium]
MAPRRLRAATKPAPTMEIVKMSADVSRLASRAAKYRSTSGSYEDRTYGKKHLRLYAELRNQEICRILREHFPGDVALRIVEVGCGTGIVLEHLATRFPQHSLIGVDACRAMLRQAKARARDKRLPAAFGCASCESLPLDDASVDVVLATRFIHLFRHDEKKRIYAEFRRVLRPGGVIAVEYYARPFACFRYHLLGLRKNKRKEEFFSHYPTRHEVFDIVGGAYRRRPVRLAGSRLLIRLLGTALLAELTRRAAGVPGMGLLVDEYFVVTKK